MRVNDQEIVFRFTIWGVMLAAVLLAVYLGIALGDATYDSYYNILAIAGCILIMVWVVVAKDKWWLPFPVAVAMGGLFYVGVKIYLHELVLAICLLPLILNIAARKEAMGALRERIPKSVWILSFYLLAHWVICLSVNRMEGMGGAGGVSRQYLNAGWPLIIFFAFYLYGHSRYLKVALVLMYAAYLFRFLMGIYFYFTMPEKGLIEEVQELIYIPLINYVPTASGVQDLRGSTIGLASICLVYCSLCRSHLWKSFHFLTALVAISANLLGGGRAYFAICLILIAFWALITKKILPLVMVLFVIISVVALLNSDPFMIESMPPRIQRTLSGLIFTTDQLNIQKEVGASNEYHERLRQMGYERWTENLRSILVGHGIRPFDEAAWNDKTTDDVTRFSEQAKFTGRYEKGLWTVLATFGVIGFILYLALMWFLVMDAFRALWRDGICDFEHGFYFLASFAIVSWLITMPLTGGFPSQEILMALFAKVAYEDSRNPLGKPRESLAVAKDEEANIGPVAPISSRI